MVDHMWSFSSQHDLSGNGWVSLHDAALFNDEWTDGNCRVRPHRKPADFNGNGVVGDEDVQRLLNNFGESVARFRRGDIDGNSFVGVLDALYMLHLYEGDSDLTLRSGGEPTAAAQLKQVICANSNDLPEDAEVDCPSQAD